MLESIKKIKSLEELAALHGATFGKNGTMTARLKRAKELSMDERTRLNEENASLRAAFRMRQEELEEAIMMTALVGQKLDAAAQIASRAPVESNGKLHPLTRSLAEITAIFESMEYGLRTGPEIEDDWHNFTALNTPEYHPARDMQDTFFVKGGNLLRTQTSAVQIRAMESEGAPIKIFCPGTVFRREIDATHSPMFHQIEGLNVAENIKLSDMVRDIREFLHRFFGREFNMRVRPSYFPFTEPSVEVDIEWKSGKWLEIMGAGMVHPNVLKNCRIDPSKYQGFAFGFGWDRLAMLKYGLNDLRKFYGGDIRWLKNNDF
ncbi:MAG: phenylalanine--tRNA ligase subunit alpha [Rickettsiales bacterium]|jgi:phenylalanyl-tRNA synthetase alpha chain|nr:phenylalanine--tRNA ligase subunit alpha [Rickettsiales bacterium]